VKVGEVKSVHFRNGDRESNNMPIRMFAANEWKCQKRTLDRATCAVAVYGRQRAGKIGHDRLAEQVGELYRVAAIAPGSVQGEDYKIPIWPARFGRFPCPAKDAVVAEGADRPGVTGLTSLLAFVGVLQSSQGTREGHPHRVSGDELVFGAHMRGGVSRARGDVAVPHKFHNGWGRRSAEVWDSAG